MNLRKKLVGQSGAATLALASLVITVGCSTPSNRSEQATNPGQVPTITSSPVIRSATPLKIIFPNRADSTDLQSKANAVVAFLSKQTNTPLVAVVADDTAAVEALRADQADVAFLSSRPALKAEKLAGSRLYLAEVRPSYSGGQTYRSVMVVRQDSPLQSQADAKQTLEQLRGQKIAFTSPTSGSGFIFPVGDLVKQGLVPSRDRLDGFFGQVTYGNNYSGALQALLRGQVDVAAVSEYALKPPYITEADAKQLRVLYAISGVPAHGVAIDDDVPAEVRQQLISALQQLNQPENNALLKNLYGSTELVPVEHNTHLAAMRDALQRAGIE